jgi:crotonobetainyl-CoA:carnitine CoA-transferase CaiB-like acyl-CoA transferase
MVAPLEGIRVVEVANWLAAPSAAALLGDLGADVIKVEPPGGDVFRRFDLRAIGYSREFELNYAFELDNRGKRSITVALDRPGGPELVHRLCARGDLFITNLTQPRRERYRLTEEAVREASPRIVYASLTGYGTRGPDAARPGFDYAAFWARAGVMGVLGEPPSAPPLCRGGQGDHTTALNLLAAVLAALRVREQTGEGQYVDVTLFGTGIWTIGADISAALSAREQPARHDRAAPANPIWNSYRTSDERWILFVMHQPEPYWPRFCAAIGEPDWASDERYDSAPKRAERSVELVGALWPPAA